MHPSANVAHPGNQQGQLAEPQLKLSTSHIDFGASNTQHALTLTNAGGQQVNWQAGVDSNSSWLGISPTFGTLSKQDTATITVNRSNLAVQAYTGYINFFQQGTNIPLTLKVTMSVTTIICYCDRQPFTYSDCWSLTLTSYGYLNKCTDIQCYPGQQSGTAGVYPVQSRHCPA